ncbi:ABC transporter ATP-binding protein [Balneatrix alpica]|uniref:ABC transporter ATP-binding protein n=1 Tax=Balneatrix alpica TaxID=75684 RepID=A0ABV5ZBA5_9GAMM|nr:ABC transporter ATP-binding protein [Balneatrix alpica]
MTAVPLLALEGITKDYPGCRANDDVSLSLQAGEIRALLGENGAGKSTLMKIIYGLVKPDAGTLRWQGQEVQVKDPAHARRLGIGMVFQHFSLFETLSIAENIALALEPEAAADRQVLAKRIKEVSKQYGMPLDPQRLVYTLSTGERQRVEIVRCLLQDIKLLILDEPTSVLTPQEVEVLFVTLRQLAAEGCSILFISHKLKEVKALCHSATILRQGRISGNCDPQLESTATMAQKMVGEGVNLETSYPPGRPGSPCLAVEQLSLPAADAFATALKQISFNLHRGEILGIAGVAGNGQAELLAALSGELQGATGSVRLLEQDILPLDVAARRQLGLGFVPEDRLGRGAVPELGLVDNALLTGYQGPAVNKGWIDFAWLRQWASDICQQFNVKTAGVDAEAKSLSGGNLQKFILGREITQRPKVLLAAHPTWGVDVGAAIVIHHALIALRDQGAGILVVSEDIDELFMISDRIGAICDGRLSPIQKTAETSLEQLGEWMAGVFEEVQDA